MKTEIVSRRASTSLRASAVQLQTFHNSLNRAPEPFSPVPGSTFTTVHFEDHGQDFLEWDIDDATGAVFGCRPFQHDLWVGRRRVDTDCLAALRPGGKVFYAGSNLCIKYAVKRVVRRVHP